MSTRIGLRDVYYSLLTQDDITGGVVYDTPVKIVGAIQANINPNSSLETLYADDGPMDTASALGQIELELNMADLTLSQQAVLLGHSVVGGVMSRLAGDTPPWLAIGFKSLKSNGHYRYVWLLKGKFQEPEMSHQTKEDTVSFQTPTITGSFVKRDYDDKWMRETDEDESGYVPDTGTNWFTDPDGSADTTPPTCTTVPVDGAGSVVVSDNIVVTFNEAMDVDTVNDGSVFILKDSDGSMVEQTGSWDAAHEVYTMNPDANLDAATAYTLYITTAVTDLAGNAKAAVEVVNFTTA